MVYNLASALNIAVAVQVGVLFGTLSYRLIFPPDAHAARRYVTYRIRLGLGHLASVDTIPQFSNWETRMYDRVNRLHDPENPSGTHTDEWFEAGLGALTLGNEIIRLRHWQVEEKFPSEVEKTLESILSALGGILDQPERAYSALQRGRDRMAQLDPGIGHPERRAWARVLGALNEMDVYLANHPRLLNRAPVP